MKPKKTLFQRVLDLGSRSVVEDIQSAGSDTVVSPEYRRQLIAMADRLDGMFFLNTGADAAKLTVGLIIARAMEMDEVLIHSRSLGPAYYKDVLRGLKCPARILLDDPAGVSVIERLPRDIQDRINVRVLPLIKAGGVIIHCVATDYSFRCGLVEQDDELSGWASFNHPPKAQSWREHFEKLWEKALPFSIVP